MSKTLSSKYDTALISNLSEKQKLDIIKFNIDLEDRNEHLKFVMQTHRELLDKNSKEVESNLKQIAELKPLVNEILKELIE